MIRIGVIGYGYWGPNIVRNLHGLDSAQVVAVCDSNPSGSKTRKTCLSRVCRLLPTQLKSCVLQTSMPWPSSLPSGRISSWQRPPWKTESTFSSKSPSLRTATQAEELIELAQKKNLKIMVDHTFLFTGAVKKIRQLIDQGELGDLYYYDSTRVNLGLFQHDIDVIWDLAPHDLSIMDYLIRKEPEAVVATGQAHLNGHADVAFITDLFPAQHHCPHQRELVISREGPNHADRGREKDAGVE